MLISTTSRNSGPEGKLKPTNVCFTNVEKHDAPSVFVAWVWDTGHHKLGVGTPQL